MPKQRNAKKRRAKATPKPARKRRTVRENFPTKLDIHFIEAKIVFDAAKAAGWSNEYALSFAMDRSSYPNWIVPEGDPTKKIGWEDGEEDPG